MNWDATKEEFELVRTITDRAVGLGFAGAGVKGGRQALDMDILAVHLNGCPLNLPALAEADDSDLAHDVGGIVRNINRKTGKLENCFFPRYASVQV